ncbi:MAG TPA: hypothetical protein VER79_06240, partial [Candidatus Limnocylindrales bacterium]|nr:hypothetical protein [Candidatus Limnocylindrales bacterium]
MRTNPSLYSRMFAVAGTLFLTFALVAALPALAQEATPTPAPTKTATSAADGAEAIEAATEQPEPASALFEPLRQDDLQLLTGNVQRPNGLAFFNDYLYTACSGDGTMYEIHSETGVTRTYIWGVSNAHSLVVEEIDDVLQMWVPDYGENRLERVTRQGVTAVTSATLQGPWGIVQEDDEHFLVSSLLGNVVHRINRDGDVTP